MKTMEQADVDTSAYLRTYFETGCEYVDGVLEPRNAGKRPHSVALRNIVLLLDSTERRVFAYPVQHLRLTLTRYRVPDVCVYLDHDPAEDIFTAPPFLCIEILSDEDRPGRLLRKLNDYVQFGVPNIWVLDPWSREAFVFEDGTLRQVFDVLSTSDPRVTARLEEVFPDA